MKLIDLTVQLLHETDAAVLVTEDGKKNVWLPRSMIEMEKKREELYEITLPEWLAKEKELI